VGDPSQMCNLVGGRKCSVGEEQTSWGSCEDSRVERARLQIEMGITDPGRNKIAQCTRAIAGHIRFDVKRPVEW